MMGRPRVLAASGDAALTALAKWVHARLDAAAVSYEQIARDTYCSRSSVSRGLCGRNLPPWKMVEAAAIRCGASTVEARKLWDAADASARRRQARTAARTPASRIDSWMIMYQALGDLIVAKVGSQRELERRDSSGLLSRSTLGAIVRWDRSLSHEVLIQILKVCEVSDAERAEWMVAWERYGEPRRQAMDDRRRAIARSRLQPWRYSPPTWF
jgi:transcriptional regulator with XRE-family HTH domain